MGSTVVGQLMIELAASTARLQSDVAEGKSIVKQGMEEMSQAVETFQTVLETLGLGEAALKLIEFAHSGIEASDQLHLLAIKADTSVESLSAMRLTAEQTGTSIDVVANSIAKFSKSIGEARVNGGPKADLLANLGIDISAGRDAGEMFAELSRKLVDMSDRQTADYVSSQLLGKSFMEMKPFMEQLTEKGELVAEVTTKQASEAHKLEDRLVELKHAFERLAENENVVNHLNDIWDAIEHTYKSSGTLAATLTGLRTVMDVVFSQPISEIGKSEQAVGLLMNRIANMKKDLDDYNNSGALAKFFDSKDYVARLKKDIEAANIALKTAIDNRNALYKQQNAASSPDEKGPDLSKKIADAKALRDAQDEANKVAAEGVKITDQLIKRIQDRINAEDGMSASMRIAAEIDDTKVNPAQAIRIINLAKEADRLEALKAAQDAFIASKVYEFNELTKLHETYMKLVETHDPAALEMARYKKELDAAAYYKTTSLATEQSYNQLMESVEADHQEKLLQLGIKGQLTRNQFESAGMMTQIGIVAGILQGATSQAAQHNKTMFEINKQASVANAIISTHEGMNEALKLGPLGIPLEAIIATAGFFNVAAIESTSFGGGSSGSAPSASGGAGAIPGQTDNPNIVAAPSLSAVTTAAKAQSQVNISIVGNDKSTFTYDQIVNQLIPVLNQAAGNGVNIKVGLA